MNTEDKRNIPFSPPDITQDEINEVINALQSGWITTGPVTKQFEKNISNYIGVSKSACLSCATASLELTLRNLEISEGDEVITSAYTYTATAAVIHHVGAKIVLVDTKADSFEMDVNAIEAAISPRTKAIIAVDIGGKMCDYDSIFSVVLKQRAQFKPSGILQERLDRIAVIADSAHGFGAARNGVMSGIAADFTCFSFHAVKNLTTAEGGAVVWRDIEGVDNDWLYNLFIRKSMHGQTKDALSKTKHGGWIYDVKSLAYKCNMTDITASIGIVQLSRYEGFLHRRYEIIEMYEQAFKSLGIWTIKHFDDENMSSGHLYMVRFPGINEIQRNHLIKQMALLGVSCNVHYRPLPMLTAYQKLGFNIDDFPNAFHMYENEITLPLHTKLSDDDVNYIIECFIKVTKDFCNPDGGL